MKIIRQGNPKQIECPFCESLLEYNASDINKQQTHMNEYRDYIICPVCDSKIEIN